MKKCYNIGISVIGSGVGQSVINSLRLSRLPIKTIGLGTNPFAYGAYDCDLYDYTKSYYDEGYIDDLISKYHKYNLDLLIPGHDDEVLLYAKNKDLFKEKGVNAIFSDVDLVSLCRDKEMMSNILSKVADVFVKSFEKETLLNDIESGKIQFPLIAKPRGGYASRGIEILNKIEDLKNVLEEHIVQELAIPIKDDPNYEQYIRSINKNINPQISEISIQLVFGKNGNIIGRMMSYNKLNNGVPIEILPYENEYVWNEVDKLTDKLIELGIKGPINLQGRLTENGLKLFEMNPRFTGITGLRALMGFNEVEACVKEWLGMGDNKLSIDNSKFGIRQTADKVISINQNDIVSEINSKLGGITRRKIILLTGSTGYLGINIIENLNRNYTDEVEVWAFARNKNKAKILFGDKVANIFDKKDLDNGNLSLGLVNILIHAGFTRPNGTELEIAESLKFTINLFSSATQNQIPAIINISSQSVYGLKNKPLWNESTTPAPETAYAQAKYSSELALNAMASNHNQIYYSNIRLGALGGGALGLTKADLLSKLTSQTLSNKDLNIVSGKQVMERLDIRDAINALCKMIISNPQNWNEVYNINSGERISLEDIAHKVVGVVKANEPSNKSKVIIIQNDDIEMNFGIDSSLFRNDFKWEPKYNITDTINSLVNYFRNEI